MIPTPTTLVKLHGDGVKLLEVLDSALTEANRQHAVLHVVLRVRAKLADALALNGTHLTARVFTGEGHTEFFSGTVDCAQVNRAVVTLTCVGLTGDRSREFHTRTFGEGDQPRPVGKLPGIGELIRPEEGAGLLTQPVGVLWQYAVSNFDLLCRLADRHGLFVRTSPTKDEIRLFRPGEGKPVAIPAEDVLPGSEQWTARRARVTAVEALSWSALTGREPKRAAKGQPRPATGGLHACFRNVGKGPRASRLCFTGLGLDPDDRAVAQALQAHESSRLGGRFTLGHKHWKIAPGQRITLTGHELNEPMTVVRRVLRFRPTAMPNADQVTNEVDVTNGDTDLPQTAVPFAAPCGLMLGRVVDVGDPANLARVKVALPWHDGGGLWSYSPQSFSAGAGGTFSGAVNLPAVGDWVVLLVEPSGYEPPVVLGSIFPGSGGSSCGATKRPTPPRPAEGRVLFRTPDGAELRVLAATGGKPMSVLLGITGADGKETCGLKLYADGKVDFHGADLLFRGRSLVLRAKTDVCGSLDVQEDNA